MIRNILYRIVDFFLGGYVSWREIELRSHLQRELFRVGEGMAEIQQKVSAHAGRLSRAERIIVAASEPVKPGNHIRPGKSFGNEVRL